MNPATCHYCDTEYPLYATAEGYCCEQHLQADFLDRWPTMRERVLAEPERWPTLFRLYQERAAEDQTAAGGGKAAGALRR